MEQKIKNRKRWYWIGAALLLVGIVIGVVYLFSPQSTSPNMVTEREAKKVEKQISVTILRYEQDLFRIDFEHFDEEITKLTEKYPPYLIDKKYAQDPEVKKMLQGYLDDRFIKDLYSKTQTLFADIEPLKEELKQAFSYYLNYFLEDSVPTMITIVPGLDLQMPSVYIFDQILYINLDQYLGAGYSYYAKMGIPKYITERMEAKYIPVDIFKKAIVYRHLPNKEPVTLLDWMVQEGKKLYFTEMMLPKLPKNLIIGYTEEKFEWAETYYPNVWGHLIEKNQIFSKSDDVVRNMIEESPFTKPFGNVSPGRMGQFIGWKIVKEFMKNNPEVTLEQLMKMENAQNILDRSTFKPIIKK